MYILTQWGEGIVCNFHSIQVESGRVHEINAYDCYDELCPLHLGTYSSYQRCMEVIQEIYQALNRGEKVFKMPRE